VDGAFFILVKRDIIQGITCSSAERAEMRKAGSARESRQSVCSAVKQIWNIGRASKQNANRHSSSVVINKSSAQGVSMG
jgi:hypothetical protein